MSRFGPCVQWVTPLPPLRTGISLYSRDMLRCVDRRWDVRVVPEDGSSLDRFDTIETTSTRRLDDSQPLIVQIGNSEFHRTAFRVALERRGILVLHDFVLHHALLADFLRRGKAKEYWRELHERYGPLGHRVGSELLRGRTMPDLTELPLSERYIENAALTIVHSRYAERLVQHACPDARVERVPMGVSIPPEIPREVARDVLGLPHSQFIACSVTHVNPHKRIPVVLRAIRKLVARLPESHLILAGTGSDGADVASEIRMLGIDRFVSTWGFVDQPTARLLVAASDACVNLRYPSTGETSASLLRLLAAGRPVLVTDGDAVAELPPGVGLAVPVDRLEADMISETLWTLANDDEFRGSAGRLARSYVIERHTMGAAVDGYRRAVDAAYGIALPGLDDDVVMEESPALDQPSVPDRTPVSGAMHEVVATAISDLGLAPQDGLLRDAAHAMVDLELDRLHDPAPPSSRLPRARLLGRLACPSCDGTPELEASKLRCRRCGRTYPCDGGIPRLHAASDSMD